MGNQFSVFGFICYSIAQKNFSSLACGPSIYFCTSNERERRGGRLASIFIGGRLPGCSRGPSQSSLKYGLLALPVSLVVPFPHEELYVIEEASDDCFLLSFLRHHSIKLCSHVLAGLVALARLEAFNIRNGFIL